MTICTNPKDEQTKQIHVRNGMIRALANSHNS
jgi:hypothetical protein